MCSMMTAHPLPAAIMTRLPRLLAACALLSLSTLAAAEAPGCHYVDVGKLELKEPQAGRITVDGEINGTPAVMLIDTGASLSYLMKAAADKLGIPLDSSGATNHGIGGNSVTYIARVKDFSVGNLHSGK